LTLIKTEEHHSASKQFADLCLLIKGMEKPLADLRENYGYGALTEADCPAHPRPLFEKWLQEAMETEKPDPNAMTLCTVGPNGQPSARTVLLKGLTDEDGFLLFTHYTGKKGKEIAHNDQVALLFWWRNLERQVRIEGRATKVSREKSEAYFHTRPKGSQIGAAASPQSEVVSRDALLQSFNELTEKFRAVEQIPLPDNWGGYEVQPKLIEFWQGRPNRLHDRIQYQLTEQGWVKERLAP
jgi:pyridoxamine 5'-phosphate oxidase